MACERNDRKGVSGSVIRIEQVPQGFPRSEQKQNTAIRQRQNHGHPGIWSTSVMVWRVYWKRKADTPTKPADEKKFYCDLHGHNKNHNTEDCYKLKWHVKRAKQGEVRKDMDK
eukprot:6180599-Ditylum_brightwellii.AAC.1